MKIYHKIVIRNGAENSQEIFEIHNKGEVNAYSFEELCVIFEHENLTTEDFNLITEGVEEIDDCIAIWEQINE